MPDRNLPPPTAPGPLLPWLLAALSDSNRTRVKELLRSGRVLVNDVSTTRHDHPLLPGDRVTIAAVAPVRPTVPIVHEDAELIAIDKPSGLLSVATDAEKADTAFARLAKFLDARRAGRPFVVHRIDRETSGLLLFARSPMIRDRLQESWPAVRKEYLAVVEGRPREPEGTIDTPLTEGRDLRVRPGQGPDAKPAVSRYRVLKERAGLSLVSVVIETGRKHQIRVHLAGLGCPVAGDRMYGAKSDPLGRLGLHAWRLTLPRPTTGAELRLEAPIPAALRRAT